MADPKPGLPPPTREPPEYACIAALAAFALVWFALVSTSALWTPFPLVLSDEANYLLPTLYGYRAGNYARWGIVAQIPNVLYYRLYGLFAGADIYAAAKVLNAALVAGVALPAYAVARSYLGSWQAAAFAALAICVPMGSYARYFMPECLYYFGFWCAICVTLRAIACSMPIAGLCAGIALGALALVKPHALALAIGVGIFLLMRRAPIRSRAGAVAALAVAFCLARALLAFVLVGEWNLSLTGPAYRDQLAAYRFEPAVLLVNVLGHAAGLLLLAGLPIVAVGAAVADRRSQLQPAPRDLMLLSLCVLGTTVAMTLYYSYAIYFIDPVAYAAERLQGRYYAWTLPLVMLAYAALIRTRSAPRWLFTNTMLAGYAAVAAVGAWLVASVYRTGVVDYPDLAIATNGRTGGAMVALAAMAALVLTRHLRRTATGRSLWRSALPLVWWATLAVVTSSLLLLAPLAGKGFVANDVDRAMMGSAVLRAFRHDGSGMVAGSTESAVDTFRVMFHLASMARGALLAHPATLDDAAIPADVRWLILLPGTAYSGRGERETIGPLTLVRLH